MTNRERIAALWFGGAMRSVTRSLCVAIALGLVAGAATAQTNRGGIAGTVFDVNGGVLPGATVVITNIGTNKSTTTHTSKSGTFSVAPLDPVVYRVAVELPGFQRAVVEKVKVDTAVVETVDVRLRPGAVTEEVSVVAEAPVVNAQTGTASQTISERQIVEMPLNNRSVLDLAMTRATAGSASRARWSASLRTPCRSSRYRPPTSRRSMARAAAA
jgi:hypothetical protein